MTRPDAAFGPRPMEGHGAYNRNSRVQAAGIAATMALLEQAAASVPLDRGATPLVIADYGASQARNSLLPIGAAIAILRRRAAADGPLTVVHTDLAGNDFSALFQTLADDPDSYLAHDPNVFAMAIGRSFYEQILPPASVTLGWSSWAVQWLSRVPGVIPDQVQVAYSRDPAAHAAFESQAATDWRNFLAHRARELVPGGALVVLTMALDAEGSFGYAPLLAALQAALDQQVADGLLSRDEVVRMAIPTVGRSRNDLAAPFAATGSFEGLAIEQLDIFDEDDRIWSDFIGDGDAAAFGARWSAFSRASVFPSLAAALDGDDPERRQAFMDRTEAGLAARLAARPERMEIPLARMLLRKSVSTPSR